MKNKASEWGPVALLQGGDSPERDISLLSAEGVAQALSRLSIDFFTFDPKTDSMEMLIRRKPRIALIMLHGGAGENGVIQGALQSLQIPYTGSRAAACAFAMDKYATTAIWNAHQLPTIESEIVSRQEARPPLEPLLQQFDGDIFIKPNQGGSSINSARVRDTAGLEKQLRTIFDDGDDALICRHLDAEEYTVSIVADQPLPSIKIVPASATYDYDAKYFSDATQYHCPSGLSDDDEGYLRQTAERAFRVLGCSQWGRVDFLRDARTNQFYLLEANTVPGMTSHSLVPMAAAQAGMDYTQLVEALLRGAR